MSIDTNYPGESDTLWLIIAGFTALAVLLLLMLVVWRMARRVYRTTDGWLRETTLADDSALVAERLSAQVKDLEDQVARQSIHIENQEADKEFLGKQLSTATQRDSMRRQEIHAASRWMSIARNLGVEMAEELGHRYQGANKGKEPKPFMRLLQHLNELPSEVTPVTAPTVMATGAVAAALRDDLPEPPRHRDPVRRNGAKRETEA